MCQKVLGVRHFVRSASELFDSIFVTTRELSRYLKTSMRKIDVVVKSDRHEVCRPQHELYSGVGQPARPRGRECHVLDRDYLGGQGLALIETRLLERVGRSSPNDDLEIGSDVPVSDVAEFALDPRQPPEVSDRRD